jgi:hypothetical protein
VDANEVFKVPLTGLKIPWGIYWFFVAVLFFIPGTFLWAISLGGFRHWNLQRKWLDYCVISKLRRDGLWT